MAKGWIPRGGWGGGGNDAPPSIRLIEVPLGIAIQHIECGQCSVILHVHNFSVFISLVEFELTRRREGDS